MKRFLSIVMVVWSISTLYATTAAKGVFSVATNKTVQFANANELNLVQWNNLPTPSADGWRVLNHEEWTYLLSSGRTNAANLNNLGTVEGRNGLIILPDGWAQPAGVPVFKPVGQGISFDKNVYTAEEWSTMADAGAAFLPCEGYKQGEGIVNPTDHGAYWSSDQYSDVQGYSIHFNDGEIHDQNTFASKDLYYSVILVREVVVLDEQDEAEAFAAKMKNSNLRRDFAFVRRTLGKDGTYYTLCLPFDVPDIEASPLAGAEVFEFTGGSVSGATGDEVLELHMSRLVGSRLSQGVPYILRWPNTGETMTMLYFENIENWDVNTDTAADPGDETIKYHGVYPKARIPGYESGTEAHYNFFIGANNTLYWPDDQLYPDSKMKGFRAYFHITAGDVSSSLSARRNIRPVWQIEGNLSMPTGVESGKTATLKVENQKTLRNGKIVLIIDGKHYSIGGQKL